jgi:hypothetical protein
LVAFVTTWVFFTVVGRSQLFRDPGTFWHVLSGEWILRGGLPHADWLSFTRAGAPWIAHQWLAEVAMAVIYRLGGFDGLLVVSSSVIAALCALVCGHLVRGGIPRHRVLLLLALLVLASSLHFHARPQLLSILAFAILYAVLVQVDEGRARVEALFLLVPLVLLWVNSHGAVLGGVATFGIAWSAWIVAPIARLQSPLRSRRDRVMATLALLAACSTLLVNPYGLELPRTWFGIMQSTLLPRMIIEHASLVRTRSWQVLVLAVVYCAALWSVPRRAVRATALLPLVWLVLSIERVRHAPFFAVAAVLAIPGLLRESRWAWARAALPPAPLRRGAHVVPWVAAGSLVACALAFTGVGRAGGTVDRIARLEPSWPLELVPALRRAEHELGAGTPILNDMRLGAFASFYAPGLRVLVDDRWEVYGDEFMGSALAAEPAFLDEWVDRARISVAFVELGSDMQKYLDGRPAWRLVASCATAALYRRASW